MWRYKSKVKAQKVVKCCKVIKKIKHPERKAHKKKKGAFIKTHLSKETSKMYPVKVSHKNHPDF